ncbi:uncharacterized protein LOC128238797 [Mya arenaria]|uniref:uncharacterized protein LOC128238797 n=1 Tax=Mya arenaria TaxID=6604 RepID=UPI0022DF05B8|nr:uncharacterized protein LOC128238797 [Mya arenaria]
MDKKPLEYRMRVHLFGAASSPGCANYGLKYLAKICQSDLPKASFFVQNNFYVDDGLSSTETEEEAIQLIKDAQELCANGCMHLHKFISNRKRVIDLIPVSETAADVKDLDLALDQLPVERALGVRWCVENDNFKFEIMIKNVMATRRNMLSIVASHRYLFL